MTTLLECLDSDADASVVIVRLQWLNQLQNYSRDTSKDLHTQDQLSRDQLPRDQLLHYQLFMKSTTMRSTLGNQLVRNQLTELTKNA